MTEHTETICPVCGGDCPGNGCDDKKGQPMKLKARLTIDVEYEIDPAECREANMDPEKVRDALVNTLEGLPDFISGEGMFTHDYPATVSYRDHRVDVR